MKRNILLCMLIVVLLLTSCTVKQDAREETRPTEQPVTLRAITLGSEPTGGLDALYEQLDALTVPELGCILRFTYIPWGDERKQINLAVASGEYDFFPQGNFSDYQLLASRNAFLDIKPYLTLVPELVTHYQLDGSDVLAEAQIDGKLYGIPGYAAPAINVSEGFFYREDLRAQWGLDPVTDLKSMEAYLYCAKEDDAFRDKPLVTDNRVWNCLWMILAKDDYFEITGFTDTPYAVCAIASPDTVINRMETPEFREMLEYLQKWYRDGILDRRLLTLSDNEGGSGLTLFCDGEKPCETNSPMWVLNRDWLPQLTQAHPEWTYGFFLYESGGRTLEYKTSASKGSLISISSRTKYPEIAVRLLEKLHTDQRYYDLLCYGAEGVHYQLENGVVNRENISLDARYVGWTACGDGYLDRPAKYCNNESWMNGVYLPHYSKYEELSKTVPFHPLNDFRFNVNPVSTEASALAETWNTYMMPLLCGLSEDIDADLEIARLKLREAGLEEYLAEMQRQLTEFWQEQNQTE